MQKLSPLQRRKISLYSMTVHPQSLTRAFNGRRFSIWASAWQNLQNGMCAQRRLRSVWASAQSDQSSLSAWRKLGSLATYWAHNEDWSAWADAQADLSICWTHMPFCRFCHALTHIVSNISVYRQRSPDQTAWMHRMTCPTLTAWSTHRTLSHSIVTNDFVMNSEVPD